MKRLTFTLVLIFCTSLTTLFAQVSEADRASLLQNLQTSTDQLNASIKGLTEEQWLYKSSADAWSIAECVEHLAKSEQNIFGMAQMSLQQEPPANIKEKHNFTDEMIMALITSREKKVKTRTEFEPTQQFDDYKGSLKAFKDKRKDNIKYVKSTQDGLRNSYAEFPFGWVDTYQVILFMSGHTQRHIAQIEEIKRSTEYPL